MLSATSAGAHGRGTTMTSCQINRRGLITGGVGLAVLGPCSLEALAQGNDKTAFMKAAVADIQRQQKSAKEQSAAMAKQGKLAYIHMPPAVQAFVDWDWFYLEGELEWQPNPGQSLPETRVPMGFVSDLASIPQVFWSALPKTGRYAYAAIVHDYLYWDQRTDRRTADNIFRAAMQDLKVPSAKAMLIYNAVRAGGESAWRSNTQSKKSGEKRILKRFPENRLVSWEQWRKQPGVFAD
jgi:hypothetical protein